MLTSFANANNLVQHPTYPTKANKDNWRMAFAGAADLDTYWQFWSTCSIANTWVALFSTWTATWVGDIAWDTQ